MEEEERAGTSKGETQQAKPPFLTSDNIGGAVCIFYTESPFSDFYPSSFVIDEKWFHSVEHYFNIQMLNSFGMFRLAAKLVQIENAADFRRTLRQNLKAMIKSELFDEKMFVSWRKKNALKLVKKANKAKFQQNLHLKQNLLATGERIMIFASKNDFLMGIGMTETGFLSYTRNNELTLEKLLDYLTGVTASPKEIGSNFLGIALMEIRAEMSEKKSVLADWKALRGIEDGEKSVDSPVSSANTDEPKSAEKEAKKGSDMSETAESSLISTNGHKETVEVSEGSEPREVIVLPNEKRIMYRKKDAVPRIIGDPEDLKRRQLKAAELNTTDENQGGKSAALFPDSSQSNSVVLQRLKKLRSEKPMVNPFSFDSPRPSSSSQKPSENQQSAVSSKSITTHLSKQSSPFMPAKTSTPDTEQITPDSIIFMRTPGFENEPTLCERIQQMQRESVRKKKKKKPSGPVYPMEKGEIVPDGVVVSEGNALPRMTPAFAPEPPPEEAFAKPAGLPPHLLHLLPRPPPPPGCDPSHSQPTPLFPGPYWRPPRIPNEPCPLFDAPLPRTSLMNRLPPDSANLQPLGRPVPVPAPQKNLPLPKAPPADLSEQKECWKMPENPLKDILKKAMILRKKIKDRTSGAETGPGRTGGTPSFADEGSNPLSKRKRTTPETSGAENEPATSDPVAFDRKLFPFGMEATLADLEEMGFVPPPINAVTGDPSVQRRNRHRKKYDYMTFFDTAEAAFRHHANRWQKGGRLGITGVMEHLNSSDEDEEEDVVLVNYASSSDEEETIDGERRKKVKRHFESKVIFVDTAQYEQYVRYYHKTHGVVPLPSEMDANLDMDYLRQFHQYYRTALNPWDYQEMDTGLGTGPEELLSAADFWQLSRWRWERQLEGNVQRTEVEQQALKEGEVTAAAQPVSYSADKTQYSTKSAQDSVPFIVTMESYVQSDSLVDVSRTSVSDPAPV